MLLKKEKKTECLAQISYQLPTLLNEVGINISLSSQNDLAQMILDQVEHKFFSPTSKFFAEVILLPIHFGGTLLLRTFLPNAVLIKKDCGNHELTQIPQDKIEKLDQLITNKILYQYRDDVIEQYPIEETKEYTITTKIPTSKKHLAASSMPKIEQNELQNLALPESPSFSLKKPLIFSEIPPYSWQSSSSSYFGGQSSQYTSNYNNFELLARSKGTIKNISPKNIYKTSKTRKYDSLWCTIL